MIDLDHNATTPLDPRVRAAMVELWARDDLGNPSSPHGRGRAAREVIEAARRRVAAALHTEPLGVTFTSGGTEADNLAVLGAARALREQGRPCGVLTSPLEHPAVGAAVARLEREGFPVERVSVDAQGRIDPDDLAQRLRDRPELGLCSLAAANHELGNAYDVAAFSAALRAVRPQVLIHVDAVQALGKVPVSLTEWGVDLVSISGHKIGGPVGSGALVHHRNLRVEPMLCGGQQERGRRGGTEGLWAIHGLGVAVELAVAEQPSRRATMVARRAQLLQGLCARLGARIHGDLEHHVGNTLNVAFEGCAGELVMMALDLEGIAVSTGAACSSGVLQASPVLRALGQSPQRALEAVRLSISASTTEAEIDAVLAALTDAVPRIRHAASKETDAS
ncbi:cysteine desulfurase family protein [Paraliomyxa miuraensis]|uniref:cysteine desulfurase family protein n=1 Tax=Paraliomyxa miuraensis TaxID=376150 RepID=UPI00224DF13E|nr:cysteine desulfurase family protein [Paraliomyxa miuraensis]MCX4245666.1 cysteine desulfurase [Paraliomyxa miuraensis]